MEDLEKTQITKKLVSEKPEWPSVLAFLIDDLFKNPTKYGLVKSGGEYIWKKAIYKKDECTV